MLMINRLLRIKIRKFFKFRRYSISKVKPFTLVGMGNPLLDISAHVELDLLKKYELKQNHAYLGEMKHQPLYDELIQNYQVEYLAGGAVQNSLRVCQWILQCPYSTVFFGCVGNDEFSQILEKKAQKNGVYTKYQRSNDLSTGKCAVLVTGTNRTLIANLASAEKFTIDHLEKSENECMIENAKYFYISGFFLTVCLACILKIAQHACQNNKSFIFNLSANYISQRYMPALMLVLPFVDILVGNEYEMLAFAKSNNWPLGKDELKEIGSRIQCLPKYNSERSRIVIITQGPAEILVIQNDGCIKAYEVPLLAEKDIVDTNGAGDAFVGGFLAQYLQQRSIDVCVHCGIYAAQHIIGQSGCTFKGPPNFNAEEFELEKE